MDARGLAARIYDLPTVGRRTVIAMIVLIAVGIGWWSLAARSPDAPVALWWPGIGVMFVAVLASRGRRLGVAVVIIVAVAVSNVLGGQPLDLAIAYGVANAVELWITVRVLTRGRAHAEFTTLPHIGWFLISVGIGATIFSLLAGSAAALLAGADLVRTASSLVTSHGSALFAIAPVALVPLTVRLRVPRWEPVVQTLALALLTVVVFAPAQALALTFLIITTLMWGAYRLPPFMVAVQTVMLAVVATLATAIGIGPFAVLLQSDLRGAIFALQLFVMTHAAAALFVSGQSADWQMTLRALADRERDASAVAENLRKLNVQKDDFIASVSHELRTPVTSILGFAEQLTEADLDGDNRLAGRIIYRNARRLADVIEDVLQLSSLTSVEVVTRPVVEVDVRRLLAECVEDATGLVAPERGVRVALHLPEAPITMLGVEQDLARVCANLLSNAIKFSPSGSTVDVTVVDDGEWVELRIVDQGPGIPLADQEAVWDRFYRVQSDRHSDVPGTGLGLPIVRALVEQRIGGKVTLHSDGHSGTTAVVRVPRMPPEVPGDGATG